MKKIKYQRGFTLVEMLVVIGLIALLSTIVLIAVNPARQFKFARDSERKAHLTAILNSVGQNMSEHSGKLMCGENPGFIPTSTSTIASEGSTGSFDLATCIVPTYLAKMPFDPALTTAHFNSLSDYQTGYSIKQDSYGHVTLFAQSEMDPEGTMSATR